MDLTGGTIRRDQEGNLPSCLLTRAQICSLEDSFERVGRCDAVACNSFEVGDGEVCGIDIYATIGFSSRILFVMAKTTNFFPFGAVYPFNTRMY